MNINNGNMKSNNMKYICVDIDGVIADFGSVFRSIVERELGLKIPYNADRYGYEKLYPNKSKEITDLFNKEVSNGLFKSLPPIKLSIQCINCLYLTNYIILATTRPTTSSKDTIEWLRRHGINYDFLFVNKEKIKILKMFPNIDYIIDDKPSTLKEFKKAKIKTIAFDYGYNKRVRVDYRCKNWVQIMEVIRNGKLRGSYLQRIGVYSKNNKNIHKGRNRSNKTI